jgi:hypothetical protein
MESAALAMTRVASKKPPVIRRIAATGEMIDTRARTQ